MPKTMGRRREEKVDEEELARLMSSEEAEQTKIRVKMPNTKGLEYWKYLTGKITS